ncbi:hypothetical protein FKG94_00475 [Exilibacterium tricleocarpae]|uniref:Uncharacterized protein n=1 Tax=Exilibacterium tricleocarpae TaxID=2591008 RepID=A0A545U9C4_9GAMM|nr:hypothetical protein [Exilibacterium tricleocarpae]TQV86070.1 hypothetical protein FKG94_00475 [Exilibacterium tricleocarpae]
MFVAYSTTLGAEEIYKCKVQSAQSLQNDGHLDAGNFARLHIGKLFAVETLTGKMDGALSNHNTEGQPTVVDAGSKTQSYKVITVYEPTTAVDYLYIEVFNRNQPKPFMFLKGTDLFGGTCKLAAAVD